MQNIPQPRAVAQSPKGFAIGSDLDSVTVAFCIIEAAAGCSSPAKTFGCDAGGVPIVVQAGRQPSSGTARRATLSGTATQVLKQLAAALEPLTSRSALVCAPPPAEKNVWAFVREREREANPGTISRTKRFFRETDGPALLGLDLDTKGWPTELKEKIRRTPGAVTAVLESVAPSLAGTAMLLRNSSSSGVRNKLTGETTAGGSQHRYFIAISGAGRARFSRILHERLVLAGYGYGFITQAGTIEVRSLIDYAASSDASRLWFEGAAVLADGDLEFTPSGREAIVKPGALLDMDRLIDLSSDERAALAEIEKEIKAELADAAREQRAEWIEQRKAKLIAKGVAPERAEKRLRLAVEQHQLEDDFEVQFDDGSSATVTEILENRKAFHKLTGPDPIEPDYGGGRNKAILYTDGQYARISSHAHGGITYILHESGDRIAARYWEEPAALPAPTVNAGPADIFGHEDLAELGDLPKNSVPTWLLPWIRSEARRKGVSEAFAAACSVTALAAAVGNSLRVRVRERDNSWEEPAGLWMCLVADPGSTKSAVMAAATGPIEKLNSELIREWRPRHEAWRKAEAAAKRRKADAPAADAGPEPKCGRRTADNFTAEKLVQILASNPRGLLCAPDELMGLLGQLGAYKRNGDGDRSQLLRLFDGGSISVDRVGSGTSEAESALLSILAGSQPDKIRELAAGMSSDGLLQRFIFVQDDGRRRRGLDEEPDAQADATYKRVVRGLATQEYLSPSAIRFEPFVAKTVEEASERIDQLRYGVGAGPALAGHLSKWGKILPRLALTFHAASEFERHGAVDPTKGIPLATVETATNFARFLVRHSLTFHETYFGAPEQAGDALWIGEFLLTRSHLTSVSRRDLYDANKSFRLDGNRKLFAAARELENAGWLEATEIKGDGPTKWRVDPRIHSRFAEHAERAKRQRAERRGLIEDSARARGWIGGQSKDDAGANLAASGLFD